MAAGAAEAAEAAVAVVEVGSAQQFEELLRLKTKYAGRREGWRTRGRRSGASRDLGAPRHVRSRARGPTAALLGPRRYPLLGKRSAAAREHNGPAVQRPACSAS